MGQHGYVYVLSNPSMSGVVKIGRSKYGGAARAKALFDTGVPQPFVLEFEIFVDNPIEIERATHDRLDVFRIRQEREFFKCDIMTAIEAVMGEYASYNEMAVINSDEFVAIEAANKFAAQLDTHPFCMCHAFNFLTKEAAKEALDKRNSHAQELLAEFYEKQNGEG